MTRRKSASRHYTIFQGERATHAPASSTLVYANEERHSVNRPVTNITASATRQRLTFPVRILSSSSIVSTRIQRINLATLPTDLILRIADHLTPRISPFSTISTDEDQGSVSREWLDMGRDLMAFRSCCKTIYWGLKGSEGTRFGVNWSGEDEVRNGDPFRIEERLRCLHSIQGLPAGAMSHHVNHRKIRHYWIHSTLTYATVPDAAHSLFLGKAAHSMTRLNSYAFVHLDETSVVEQTPYRTIDITAPLLSKVHHEHLRELYFCGVSINPIDLPRLPNVEALTMNACHDSALLLINQCPKLRIVKAWRDWSRSPKIQVSAWWNKDVWKTVEHVELRGFSGSKGEPLMLEWLESYKAFLNSTPDRSTIPLQSLRLCEAYAQVELLNTLLPTLRLNEFPNFVSFTIMIWRDRHFNPNLIGKIVDFLPKNLKRLGIHLENEEGNWWPGSLTEYAAELIRLPELETFSWNYTIYAELDFDSTRPENFGPCRHFARRLSSSLKTLKWLNQTVFLKKDDGGAWVWSDAVDSKEDAKERHAKGKAKIKVGNAVGLFDKLQSAAGQNVEDGEDEESADDSGFFDAAEF